MLNSVVIVEESEEKVSEFLREHYTYGGKSLADNAVIKEIDLQSPGLVMNSFDSDTGVINE